MDKKEKIYESLDNMTREEKLREARKLQEEVASEYGNIISSKDIHEILRSMRDKNSAYNK